MFPVSIEYLYNGDFFIHSIRVFDKLDLIDNQKDDLNIDKLWRYHLATQLQWTAPFDRNSYNRQNMMNRAYKGSWNKILLACFVDIVIVDFFPFWYQALHKNISSANGRKSSIIVFLPGRYRTTLLGKCNKRDTP